MLCTISFIASQRARKACASAPTGCDTLKWMLPSPRWPKATTRAPGANASTAGVASLIKAGTRPTSTETSCLIEAPSLPCASERHSRSCQNAARCSSEAAIEASAPGTRVVAFGHLGDGNIHFNVSQPVGGDPQAFLDSWHAMNEIVHAIVGRLGGSYSAEHGVGQLKRELLARWKDPASLAVMRHIKAALDPNGVMNPGKVL